MDSDGSYFQCPHCRTRYAASARARSADGKKINCKQCQESFILTIVSGFKPLPQTVKKTTVHRKPVKPEPQPVMKRKTVPRKKRSLLQVGTLLILLSAVAAVGGWQWLEHDDQAADRVQSGLLAKSKQADVAEESVLMSAEEVKKMTQEVPSPDPSTLNFVVSAACRDVAAAQWLNDYTLTHSRFKQAEFVRLLDESVSLTARVHKQCQNDQLLLSVVESAKQGKKPIWLVPLIDALVNPEYDSTTVVGDEGF